MVHGRVIVRKLLMLPKLSRVTVILTDQSPFTNLGLEWAGSINLVDHYRGRTASEWQSVFAAHSRVSGLTIDSSIGSAFDHALFNHLDSSLAQRILSQYQEITRSPIDANQNRDSVVVKDGQGKLWCLTKAEPLNLKSYLKSSHEWHTITHAMTKWTNQGYKIVLLALRSVSHTEWQRFKNSPEKDVNTLACDLVPISLIAFARAVHPAIKQSIQQASEASIKTIIATEDSAPAVLGLGKKIDLYTSKPRIITGEELNGISESQLNLLLRDDRQILFSEINPEGKQKIIAGLQQIGNVVALIGDPKRDVTALKAADIGVIMGKANRGKDLEAADLVLADNSFNSLIAAVDESRVIYRNCKRIISYKLSIIVSLLILFLVIFLIR